MGSLFVGNACLYTISRVTVRLRESIGLREEYSSVLCAIIQFQVPEK